MEFVEGLPSLSEGEVDKVNQNLHEDYLHWVYGGALSWKDILLFYVA